MVVLVDENLLDEELKRNNMREVSKIIEFINGKVYVDYLELSKDMRRLVYDFDPFDKESIIEYVFKNLLPEHKKLFSTANIVMRDEVRPRRCLNLPPLLSGCFSQT
jgi:hypothetical protein